MPLIRECRRSPPDRRRRPGRVAAAAVRRRAAARSRDAIIEPSWGGVRVSLGRPRPTARRDDADRRRRASTARRSSPGSPMPSPARLWPGSSILDGFLTVEPTQARRPRADRDGAARRAAQMMTQHVRRRPLLRAPRPSAISIPTGRSPSWRWTCSRSTARSLLDVPLLERKRLLDGALEAGRPRPDHPVRPAAHRQLRRHVARPGFGGLAYKAANSRYHPDRRATTTGSSCRSDPAERRRSLRRQRRGSGPATGRPSAAWYGGPDALERADARHPGRDRPARSRRHHGRHPELSERGDHRPRRARRPGRPGPVLPGPAAGPRQRRRRLPGRHPARRRRDRAARTTSSGSCSSARPTASSASA